MNLLEVFTRYPTQDACIEHLELARWVTFHAARIVAARL